MKVERHHDCRTGPLALLLPFQQSASTIWPFSLLIQSAGKLFPRRETLLQNTQNYESIGSRSSTLNVNPDKDSRSFLTRALSRNRAGSSRTTSVGLLPVSSTQDEFDPRQASPWPPALAPRASWRRCEASAWLSCPWRSAAWRVSQPPLPERRRIPSGLGKIR
jgi:hypothetical protein